MHAWERGASRAKPGRFGSFAFAMKNRHFGGECSWVLAGKARRCGKFWVFACVPNPGKQSIWRQCPPSARKESTKKTAKSSRFYPCAERGFQDSGRMGCAQSKQLTYDSTRSCMFSWLWILDGRRFATRIGAIRANRFARRLDSQKNLLAST